MLVYTFGLVLGAKISSTRERKRNATRKKIQCKEMNSKKKEKEHHKGRGKEAQEAWTHLGNSKELQMHQARQESPERRLQFKKPERNRQNRTSKGESTSGK